MALFICFPQELTVETCFKFQGSTRESYGIVDVSFGRRSGTAGATLTATQSPIDGTGSATRGWTPGNHVVASPVYQKVDGHKRQQGICISPPSDYASVDGNQLWPRSMSREHIRTRAQLVESLQHSLCAAGCHKAPCKCSLLLAIDYERSFL